VTDLRWQKASGSRFLTFTMLLTRISHKDNRHTPSKPIQKAEQKENSI